MSLFHGSVFQSKRSCPVKKTPYEETNAADSHSEKRRADGVGSLRCQHLHKTGCTKAQRSQQNEDWSFKRKHPPPPRKKVLEQNSGKKKSTQKQLFSVSFVCPTPWKESENDLHEGQRENTGHARQQHQNAHFRRLVDADDTQNTTDVLYLRAHDEN